jgi:glycolate oxidase subunit GlcD
MAKMRKLLSWSAEDRTAIVQAGLVNLDLSVIVGKKGLYYAPDPSSQKASTIGGNLAENAGGPHCFKYGMTTDHILGLQFVDGRGEIVIADLEEGPDLVGLFTGSEGTFGVVTEIKVRLSKSPEKVQTFLASYSSMESACQAVSKIVRCGIVPAALEILDRLTIEAVEASVFAAGYPRDAEAVLLVELDGPSVEVEADRPKVVSILQEEQPLAIESTTDKEQRLRLWKGRKGAFGAMGRLKPNIFVLDGVVPTSQLAATLKQVANIGKKHGIVLSNVFHAGDGNLHPNLSFDGRDQNETKRAMAAGMEILQLCVEAGGSISGEHGIGYEKKEAMCFMFDDADLSAFRDLRSCFDPKRVCNPEKFFPTGGGCKEGRSAKLGEDQNV